jgi:tol-pal system protein YbgF
MPPRIFTRFRPATGDKVRATVGRVSGLLAALLFVLLVGVSAAAPARAQGLFGGGEDDRRAAELSLRINQLEGQIRGLNGQIEQLNFQIRQLQDNLVRMQKDYEFRLQELENAGAKRPQKKSEMPVEQGTTATAAAPTPVPAMPAAPTIAAAPPAPAMPSRGTPPADLGTLSSTDPIGGLIGAAPMNLGAPGVEARAPASDPGLAPIPGVDPRYASAQPTASARDEYDAAYGYVLNGEYELAEKSFKTFIANHPTDKRIGSAEFWLGESFFVRSRNKEAAEAFLKSYTQFPDGPKAPDSLLKLGLSLAALGEKKAACTTYDELLTKYPKASKALRDRAAAEKTRGKC